MHIFIHPLQTHSKHYHHGWDLLVLLYLKLLMLWKSLPVATLPCSLSRVKVSVRPLSSPRLLLLLKLPSKQPPLPCEHYYSGDHSISLSRFASQRPTRRCGVREKWWKKKERNETESWARIVSHWLQFAVQWHAELFQSYRNTGTTGGLLLSATSW